MKLETLYYFNVSKIKSSRKITLPNKLSNSRKYSSIATHVLNRKVFINTNSIYNLIILIN